MAGSPVFRQTSCPIPNSKPGPGPNSGPGSVNGSPKLSSNKPIVAPKPASPAVPPKPARLDHKRIGNLMLMNLGCPIDQINIQIEKFLKFLRAGHVTRVSHTITYFV